ncbi:MAG: hypothetical protein IPM34_06585 [Saprospiraceae bacterium]|nr:hypothetical protein [Saprospiraceae bacterium]
MSNKHIENKNTAIDALGKSMRDAMSDPSQLETLYRKNKSAFRSAFFAVYPDFRHLPLAEFWKERLRENRDEITWGQKSDLLFLIVVCLVAGFIAKIPHFMGLIEDTFYQRNFSFTVLPFLTAFFVWKQNLSRMQTLVLFLMHAIAAIYINLLPVNGLSDTLTLACMHLPLVLWSGVAYAYCGGTWRDHSKKLDFLKFNGDLLVVSAILLAAAGLFTAVSFGLFELIGIKLEFVFTKFMAPFGLPAIPILATFLVYTNPQLVKWISPIVAKVFTPLALLLVVVYLLTMVFTGKNPYGDREFLILFNVLLLGVMALIFFSLSVDRNTSGHLYWIMLLFALGCASIVLNGFALSAILFRISEWGWTPNRTAVLGSNILILTNLVLVAYQLIRSLMQNPDPEAVKNSIGAFLPVYVIWAAIVAFMFPVLFDFQ